jgi:hypothetical protein
LHPDIVNRIEVLLREQIETYRQRFERTREGLIQNWPKNYSLFGWFLKMDTGGEIAAHMHEKGWISGSVYINVPPKDRKDDGNLVVCIEDDRENGRNKAPHKVIDVVTGSLALFPASLLHYTIPFKSKENRIVLAFDVKASE